MQRTPSEIPYRNPADLIIAPGVDLIPRIVWPGKPILATGYQMSQEYFQLPPQIYTASTISPQGDLYRHGGWIPLIIGSFLGGCGIRILDDSLTCAGACTARSSSSCCSPMSCRAARISPRCWPGSPG